MSRLFKHWIIVLFLLLFCSSAWAQLPPLVGFDRYDISDSEANILGIFTDSRGFIWIRTEAGAFRFDGNEFLHVKKELAGTLVMDISEAPDGNLWFATSEGITSLNPYKWQFTQYYHDPENPNSLGHHFVNDLQFDSLGRLWVTHDEGIDLLNIQTGEFSHFGQNPENNATLQEGPWVGKIIEDEKGNYWVGYQNPAYIDRFNPETGIFTRFDYQHPGEYVSNGYIRDLRSENGKLWVSTKKTGLYTVDLNSEKVTHYQHDSGDPSSIGAVDIYQSFTDSTGKIWIATDNGLDIFSPASEKFTHFNPDPDDKLKMRENPRGVIEDLAGNLWIVSFEGIYRTSLNNYMFQTIPTSLFATGNLAESTGEFWISTLGDGILHFDNNLTQDRHYQKDQASWGMSYDEGGTLWVSVVGQGPHRYDPQTDSFILVPFGDYSEELKWPIVTSDSSGGLWFLSWTRAFKYKNNTLKPFTYEETDYDSGEKVKKEFVGWDLRNVFVDSEGRTWIGTFDGLNKVGQHQQGLTVYKADPLKSGTISNSQITGIVQTKDGDIWISTMQGLNRYLPETDTFKIMDTSNGLPSDGIASMVIDGSGILWLGTARGIIRLDPDSGDISVFGPEHGAFSGGGIGTGFFGADGRIYMGGSIGITRFNPSEIRISTFTPPVKITGLEILDSRKGLSFKHSAPEELNLPWTNDSFSLEFAALDLTKPEALEYKIKLAGWDDDWIKLHLNNSIRYTNIPGGKYELLIQATNHQGLWIPEESWAKISVNISTHPAKTWWAISLYIILGISIISLIFLKYRAVQAGKLKDQELLNTKLTRVDKMKDEFLANTTHELRTPLNGIIGIAESLIGDSSESSSEGTKKELSLIASSGRRLTYLINDILDFSRLKEGDIELQKNPLDISRLVNTVLVLSKPLCQGKPVELINRIPADLPLVEGDVNRIQQILHNLVGNAIKFTREGSIKVSAQKSEGTEMIEISVSDTGIGIPEDKQEMIWQSFRQVDASSTREEGGTGLGLPITKRLVEIHGGAIHLKSEHHKGSSFIFTLPVSSKTITAKELGTVASVREFRDVLSESSETTTVSNAYSEKLPRILFVDDEAINRHVMEQQLKNSQYSLTTALDGEEALRLIMNNKLPDLILLDIMMPGIDGYEVCKKIREKFSANALPVIMVTAKNQVADLVKGLSVGANDFISKPYSREELLARITKHMSIAKTHTAFGRFLPMDLLGLLGRGSPDNLESGAHIEKQMTLLLTDFTGDPKIKKTDTLAFLSSFLPKVLPVIRKNHGIIHRYEGEGVMSFFPGSSADALESSIKIQKLAAAYNTEHRLRGKKAVQIDTVLHKDKLLIGTTGDDIFSGEVVLSDAVSQTLYLRDLARRLSCPIMATEPVIAQRNGNYKKRKLAFISNGLKDVLYVYEILSPDSKDEDLKIKTQNDFEEALNLFHKLQFDKASVQFGKVLETNPRDNAAIIYRERCVYYLANPPGEERITI